MKPKKTLKTNYNAKGSKKIKPKYSKTKKITQDTCSPSSKNKYTCYNDNALIKMKTLWDKRHPDYKIESSEPKEIWNSLKENMKDVCSSERCWLNQQFMENNLSSDLTTYTFAPSAPKKWNENPNEWLTSSDILNVMKQYEHTYDNFSFIGPSPIDFDEVIDGRCVWPEICNFDIIKQLKKNKTRIAFIFNLDKHYMSGSHWLTLFLDINKKKLLFFNSTGDPPTKEVYKLIQRILKQCENVETLKDIKYLENKKNHQRKNTECGIYCLYCICELLTNNKEAEYFLSHRISDKQMEELRYKFFNKYKDIKT